LLNLTLALGILLLGTAAADPGDGTEPVPTFRAGASVTLGCTVRAPDNWVINPGIPFRISFDPAYLKTAPITVNPATQDFKLKDYDNRVYIEVNVKLKKDLPDGEVRIPLKIQCGVCVADQSSCSFTEGAYEATVTVHNTPVAGSKTEALKRGIQPEEYRLPLPE
jgi:hypothetical protein